MDRLIKSIIIHCSDTPNGKWITAGDIDRWHKARGIRRTDAFRLRQNPQLTAIGYHFIIYPNGAVATGRHLDETGAHVPGYNSKSLGICLIGTGQFTPEQWQSLRRTIHSLLENALQSSHKSVRVFGHGDLPGVNKNCPGFSVEDWLANDMQPLAAHVLEKPEVADGE